MTRAFKMEKESNSVDPMWILCDNESTVDIVKNRDMIINIRQSDSPIELSGIGGKRIKIGLEGDLPGYGTVYNSSQVIANVLSFHNTSKRFKPVSYDNT
jgi:hypothetical protein